MDWSLTIGDTLRAGHAALVVEATLAHGTEAVLKVGVPGTGRELTFEATVLRLADGDACASLLRHDVERDALLLERLGAAMHDVVPDATTRQKMMCDVAARLWYPVGPDVDLPTGADKAQESADLLTQLWEESGRACADLNVLQAEGGTFKLIDPKRLRAGPACDLGTIIRCNPDTDDDLHARTNWLAARSRVDATAI